MSKWKSTDDDKYIAKGVSFNRMIVDADTPLYMAASGVQETYVVVTHPEILETEFKNQTEFWGHWKKKAGGWLKRFNDEREAEGKESILPGDVQLEEHVRLSPELKDHVKEGVKSFDYFVSGIQKFARVDKIILCIGGSGNYRHDEAHIWKYKGARKDKPLLFAEVREAIIDKYGDMIEIVDGEESDDRLGQYGFQNHMNHRKTGKWDDLLAYVDKDLDMIVSPSFNYNKPEEGIKYTDEYTAARCFCIQLLCGDKSTDNIPGLENFAEITREKYGLRKAKGIGKATAEEALNGCDTIKELFERVVECYRDYYVDDYEFTSHRGEELVYTWLDVLSENAILLYMRRFRDEFYEIEDTLRRLKIDYE